MRYGLLPTLVGAVSLISSVSFGETLQTAQQSLIAHYEDGTAEKYIIRYTGTMDVDHNESGEASHCDFHSCHPFDDRRCHWSISTYVRRDVCLVAHGGQNYCENDLATVYNTSSQNQGSAFILTQLAPENCGDAQGRFNSDLSNSRQSMADKFPLIVERDMSVVKKAISEKTKAPDVSNQP